MSGFLRAFPSPQIFISAIGAAELLHGIERATDAARRARRQHHVEQVLGNLWVLPFDLEPARCHVRLWSDLERRGQMIGAHDLQMAASVIALGHNLATHNVIEIQRFTRLALVGASPFCRP